MTSNKIQSIPRLRELVEYWKSNGDKVVFTNGCFDILHLGHIDYLEHASHKGDKLIVGLNSDNSVRRLKGEGRPINGVEARSRMLAALEFVDAVVVFKEDTPLELIAQLLPTVLVKGSDYLAEKIVGADIVVAKGGSVETIDLVEGYSTSHIINKIKNE